MKRDFSQEKIEELWSEATESCSVYLKSLANITDLEELGLPEVVVNIKISERYVEQLEEKEVLTINKLAEIITNVKEVDKTYAGYLKTLNEQLEAYGRKVQALTEMLQPEKLSVSNGSYMRELLAIGREYQEAANNSELIKVEIWLTPGHKMSEEEIAEAQEVLDRYFAEGTEAERRFFADEYTLMEELAEDDWSDAEWRRYQLMSALYTKLDSIRSVTTGAIEGVPFCGNLFEWSARTQARVRGYQFEELCSMENIFINSHTQHPYATFVGNMTGGLLTYNMASSVAGHIPGLAQRIGGWSERLSTFPILRRIRQDHLSNIIGATIVDTGAFTVPKAIIDIYNGESSETVFRNAGVDIGRNVLFNIVGEAVSGAVGRVVQRFKSGIDSRYYNPDGSPIWPPNKGFDGNPTKITLESGTLIDRYGYDGETFVSPKGVPYTERSLPLGTDKKPYTVFEVVKPIEVQAGKIAPWFGEKGGGIQYEFSQKISELLEQGILRKVQE